MEPDERIASPGLVVVDGMNALGSRPDGWWRDRPAAMARLVTGLADYADEVGIPVLVFFDGSEHGRVSAAADGRGVEVRFAPGGRDAADKAIAAYLRRHPEPGDVLVVSSDKRLRAAVKAAGGRGIGAGEFVRANL